MDDDGLINNIKSLFEYNNNHVSRCLLIIYYLKHKEVITKNEETAFKILIFKPDDNIKYFFSIISNIASLTEGIEYFQNFILKLCKANVDNIISENKELIYAEEDNVKEESGHSLNDQKILEMKLKKENIKQKRLRSGNTIITQMIN